MPSSTSPSTNSPRASLSLYIYNKHSSLSVYLDTCYSYSYSYLSITYLPIPPLVLRCAILDIPVYNSLTESLHVLFTLYSDFKANVHFQQQLEGMPEGAEGGADVWGAM